MPASSSYIASKFDMDIHANVCRLAFHGRVLHAFVDGSFDLSVLKVVKTKRRSGIVERVHDEQTVIVSGLFKREVNVADLFAGLRVELSSGERGVIEGGFGQSGKVRVRVADGIKRETVEFLERVAAERKAKAKQRARVQTVNGQTTVGEQQEPIRVVLTFRQYAYDAKKKIFQ